MNIFRYRQSSLNTEYRESIKASVSVAVHGGVVELSGSIPLPEDLNVVRLIKEKFEQPIKNEYQAY